MYIHSTYDDVSSALRLFIFDSTQRLGYDTTTRLLQSVRTPNSHDFAARLETKTRQYSVRLYNNKNTVICSRRQGRRLVLSPHTQVQPRSPAELYQNVGKDRRSSSALLSASGRGQDAFDVRSIHLHSQPASHKLQCFEDPWFG